MYLSYLTRCLEIHFVKGSIDLINLCVTLHIYFGEKHLKSTHQVIFKYKYLAINIAVMLYNRSVEFIPPIT